MKLFKLPDLGEGLPDAIIRQWHVNVGDKIKKDQPLVAMETAKALVDVVAPYDAVVEKLFGNVDDTIETGNPLIGFEGEGKAEEKKDTGTVVGKIEQASGSLFDETTRIITASTQTLTPAERAAARKKIAAKPPEGYETLSGVKRAMVLSMQQSHHDIVPVTLIDDVDIQSWTGKQDITLRIMRAIVAACKIEPTLNAHFDGKSMSLKKFKDVHLGMAIDMPHGLFVPVIKEIEKRDDKKLREKIDQFKAQAKTKSIAQTDLHGATIVLSNFGAIAGKYANPIILPPTVAIIGIGRLFQAVVLNEKSHPETHRFMPISLTVDHRAITGGEAARFLKALIDVL